MLTYKDIIKEDDIRLREKSVDLELPLSVDDIEFLNQMNEYLENGYDPEIAEKCNIRPGVGISAVQIGVLKRAFVIMASDEKQRFHHYAIINPKITSSSEELTYLPGGEGCLSIDRDVEGLIHRPRRIKARVHLYNFDDKSLNQVEIRLEDYIAIVFQHEYDHLNGVLFLDHIDKFNPFYVPENSNPIKFKYEEELED